MIGLSLVVRIRRLHGIGHLGFALRHHPVLTIVVVVVVVAAIALSNRRT